MIRFINPYFKSPLENKVALRKPEVDTWLKTQPANRVITIDELRTALPLAAADLTRGVVNQICKELGATIENPEDGGV